MSSRKRADERLVELGLFLDVEEAKRAIMADQVLYDDASRRPVKKPGEQVDSHALLTLRAQLRKYVSRGGDKIASAVSHFNFSFKDKSVIDIGASTGGFSDFALQHKAKSVCAVDVGYGQLAWKLQEDNRVSVYDRTNIRDLDIEAAGGPFDVAVADLSFVAVSDILDSIVPTVKPGGEYLILVKPQFEIEKDEVGEGGIVQDVELRREALMKVSQGFLDAGLLLLGVMASAVKGTTGNQEYFIYARNNDNKASLESRSLDPNYLEQIEDALSIV